MTGSIVSSSEDYHYHMVLELDTANMILIEELAGLQIYIW